VLDKIDPGTDSVIIPGSLQSAGLQHSRIGKLLARIISLKAKYAKRITKLEQERDQLVSEASTEALLLAQGEEIYINRHTTELFGNRSSFDLPQGGSVELKMSPSAKLEYELEDKEAAAVLEKLGLQECVNYRPTVYKNKLKEAIEKNPKLLSKLEAKGFSVEKGMIFRMKFKTCNTQIKRNVDDPESRLVLHTPQERSKTPTAST
jgi:hypothetical protein